MKKALAAKVVISTIRTIIFFLIWRSGIVSQSIIKCTVDATCNVFYKVIPSMLLTWPPTQALWCLQPAVPTLKFPYVFQCTRYVNLLLPKKTKKSSKSSFNCTCLNSYSNFFPFFLIKARNTLWTDFLSYEQLETRKLPAISQNYRFFFSWKEVRALKDVYFNFFFFKINISVSKIVGQLTILFSPCAPLLKVVARVEEQLSEYQGDSPWSEAELIDSV